MQKRSSHFAMAPVWTGLLTFAVALLFVTAVEGQRPLKRSSQTSALNMIIGEPRLISIEPMPVAEGEICEWRPASAETSLLAALQKQQESASARPRSTSTEASRSPRRV